VNIQSFCLEPPSSHQKDAELPGTDGTPDGPGTPGVTSLASIYNGLTTTGELGSCNNQSLANMAQKFKFTEAREDDWPVCPHCKKELRDIPFKTRGWLKSIAAFWCPHCRSLLSISATFNG
jgi:hypothetical protein